MYHTEGGAVSGASHGAVAARSRLPKAMTFLVEPQEILFCDFELQKTYEASFQLKNTTNEVQFVRIEKPQSRFLTLKLPRHRCTTMKVAPGLTITCKVLFRPEENSDFTCNLVVTTDCEEFTIPVYAVATRGRLTLPDFFTVTPCPVKGSNKTTLFLRNTGCLECQWRAEVSPPFNVTPSFGVAEPNGGVLPISVEFTPAKLQKYDSVILFRLGPEEDVVQELPLSGSAVEVPIVLEHTTLEFPNTFVTLENQLVVRLRNDSDHKVNFTWKSNCTDLEEEDKTERKLVEQIDAVEYAVLSASSNEATRKRLTKERLETLRKGGCIFDNGVFTIEPVSGVIYAKCVKEFVVVFNPQFEMEYLDTAFLDIDGRQQRIPLQLKGTGLGPQCELEYTHLDIGDVFIGDLHEYKIDITNKGCIEARYTVLLQDTLMGRKFTFYPSEGILPPETRQTLVVRLQSDLVGLISEVFRIHLHGSLDDLTLRFRGRIRGTSLHFEPEELDFGNVSYDCTHTRVVRMLNTGQLPIHFRLFIHESSPLHASITLQPSEGVLPPKSEQDICVVLVSNTLGNSECMLLVDVEGFGQVVESLPIKVACLVPNLEISIDQLHYGTCFVGYEYIMNLEVVNTTALLGKYDVILLEEGTSAANVSLIIGSSLSQNSSVYEIGPRSRSLLPIKLTSFVVGELRMTLYVRVVGSSGPPLPVVLTATVRGPKLELDSYSLSFGTMTLLEQVKKSIIIRNTSPISALFTASLAHSEHSVYSLEQTEGEIPPFGNMEMKVTACLNDARLFSDEIRLVVQHAEDEEYVIGVTARGKGYALVYLEPADEIDFGDVFTNTLVKKEVVILNKGRRNIDVMWNTTGGSGRAARDTSTMFRILPETATMVVNCPYTFTVQALMNTPGVLTESFVLKDKRVFKPILTANVKGNFIMPSISYSTKQVVFNYMHGAECDAGCAVITKTFTMKNTTTRAFRVTLKHTAETKGTPNPFSLLGPLSFVLNSGETHIVGITCDALYRHDSVAHSVKSRLQIVFENHPFTEYVALIANFFFPTICIEPESKKLNFGSILADTEKRLELTLTNLSSCVASNFSWSIDPVNTPTNTLMTTAEEQEPPVIKRKTFDIVPFRGTIPPGEKRIVEAVFYGTRGSHEATAICSLDGGPTYKVDLVGWSDVKVKFDCTCLDFGLLHHQASAKKKIRITSPLRVAVPFTVAIGALKCPGSLFVTPMSGTVTNKVYLTVKFSPVIPDEITETFFVQVGHLDPQPITVRCTGYANTITVVSSDEYVKLARSEDAVYTQCLQEMEDREWVPYHRKLGQKADVPYMNSKEVEAERVALCRNIFVSVASKMNILPQLDNEKGVSILGGANGENKEELTILSRYTIDFGHLTRTEVRTTDLILVNTSPFSVSLRVDTRAMNSMPLKMDPPRIPSIAPFSEVKISLTITASDSHLVANGANRYEFFVDINKGPRVLFAVCCFIATPVLTPCANVVDFGNVVIGHVKKISLDFVNNEVIPCTWKMSLIEPKPKGDTVPSATPISFNTTLVSENKRQFRVDKERGTLAAQAGMTVQLTFVSQRIGPAKAKIRLRYSSNPDDTYVILKSNSVGLDVVLSPSPLLFPPVFPYQAIQSSFIITNNEDHPVEVFSMNLDQKHHTELRILQHALEIGGKNADCATELHLPVREAGGSLPEPLLEAVFGKIQSELLSYDHIEIENAEMETSLERRGVSRPSSRKVVSSFSRLGSPLTVPQNSEIMSCSLVCGATNLQKPDPKLFVITGPPFSGKTTQTSRMVQNLDFVQLDLDELLRVEAEFDTAEGEIIRNIITEKESRKNCTNGVSSNTTMNVSTYATNPALVFANSKVVMVLHSVLKHHLEKVGHILNLVIDDFRSILTEDLEEVLFAIERATSSVGRSLQIVSLGVSEATTGLWRNLEIQKDYEKNIEESKIETLAEEAYEQLSTEERDAYNYRLLQFNKCKIALADAKKKVMHFNEEREKTPQLTIQEVVDRDIVAREEQEAMMRLTTRGKKFVAEVIQRPAWDQISELDRYKNLYVRLREMSFPLHFVVEGETSIEEVENSIIQQAALLSEKKTDTPSTPSQVDLLDEARRRADFTPEAVGLGVWQLVDKDFLLRTCDKLENFRFYTTVQQDVMVKKTGPKTVPQSPLTKVEETTRWIIPSKSSMTVTLAFCSNRVEQHVISLLFGITGTGQEIALPVVARTAYPEICRDDTSIFSLTKSRAVAGRQVSRVFLTSKRSYEFGPLIVPFVGAASPTNPKKSGKFLSDQLTGTSKNGSTSLRDNVAHDKMTFTNIGIFPAEVTLTFGKEKDSTFSVVPNKFTLPVGESTTVELRAFPEIIGEISSRLLVTVRDNPTPWFVNVSCIGTRPAVSLDGKKESLVQFGRCLVTRQAQNVITIANVSSMPVRWCILGVEKIPKEFEVIPHKGILDVNGAQSLEIVFKPLRTGVHNIQLKIEVTDSEDIPYESLPLTIKGEAHDVVLEWTRQVDFKLMHVGETKRETVRILNKGPYEVGYMLRFPKALQGILTLSPSEGTLRGLVGFKDASLVNIDVIIRFDKEGELPSALGVIEASFFDPISNELLYPVQSIPVRGEAWYTKFTIRPSCIDFGSCFANQKKQCSFELRNTGRFPLSFHLFDYKKGLNSSLEEEEGGSKKHRKSPRTDTSFQLGAFTISPNRGTVAVGDGFIFNVVTLQSESTSHREKLGIYVDHCEPELEAKGVPFELVASSTTPGIVADLSSAVDVDTVFEEQQVVTSFQHCDKSVRAYAKVERVFSFGSILVGSKTEERFRIANLSPLMCTVKVQLLPKPLRDLKEKEKKDKDVAHVEAFELVFDGEHGLSETLHLPSFESRFVTISFTPSTLQLVNAEFEAVVVGGTNPLTSSLRFGLRGEGVLPSIEYILPPPLQIPFVVNTNVYSKKNGKGRVRESRKSGVVHSLLDDDANLSLSDAIRMPLTLVGMMSGRSFSVRNTGSIPAYIRLTIPDELPKDIVVSKMKEEILLPAGATETFQLTFSPTEVVKRRVRMRVSVTENSFEDREIWLICESYFSSISFDNIDPGRDDHLTLGHWYVSKLKEHTVTLRNNSLYTVGFKWNSRSNALSCSPQVGHLSPESSIPITIRLFTDTVLNEMIPLTVDVISVDKGRSVDMNDSQLRSWLLEASPSDKRGETLGIPTTPTTSSEGYPQQNLWKSTDIVQMSSYTPTNQFTIEKTLYVSYTCDFTSHRVTLPMNGDVEVSGPIIFPLTKIFQRNSTVLRITNMGLNTLPFFFEFSEMGNWWSDGVDLSQTFTVDVMKGEVPPKTHRDVHVTFAPKTTESIKQVLIARFPHSIQSELPISLHGIAECPIVHFNVPSCDYLATRIDGDAGPELSPDTIPIMFFACGLQSKCTVNFKVINPSSTTYRYEWVAEPSEERVSPFRCLTTSGSIMSGKQSEMTFEYTAASLSTSESKWNFFITGQMAVPFLLVGKAKEPDVLLNVSKIHFGGVMLGSRNERVVELENRENLSFQFAFDPSSVDTENSFLSVKPMTGVLRGKSKIPITLSFLPKEEISINVKLLCRVKRLSDPLTINVKGEGVCVHSSLMIEDEDADDVEEPIVVPPSQVYYYNLGRVQVDMVIRKRFILSNEGQCALEYLMVVPEHRFIELTPISGVLAPRQRTVIMLSYSPKAEETLRNFKILCKIEKSTSYCIRLGAVSYVPKLHLGFSKYDFGPCFVTEFSSGAVTQAVLSMMNGEANETLILDCMLSASDVFELDSTSFVLSAGDIRNLNISFTPREVGEFTSELKILLNGTYPIIIPLSGEGVVPRVDVSNRFLKLGVARIGEVRTFDLRLECKSRALTPVSLANCVDAELKEKGISFSPNDTFVMRPREIRTVTVSFKPSIRMPEFQREVRMLVCGRETPFALLSGSCEDAEVHLDMQSILFDNVVVGAMTSRRIVIMNSGDISQRFKWDLERGVNGDIKVTPNTGVVRAHSEQTCEFVFVPKKSGISFQRPAFVEFDNAPPLSVKVEAHSVDQPKADEILEFCCKVRSSVTKTVTVENTTETVCTIQPVIDSRIWTTVKKVVVNPRSTATIPITYSPVMVAKQKDVANLFIPLPTGSARSIQLEGVALQSSEIAELAEKVVEVKTPHNETFDLQNVTSQPLRFFTTVSWTPEPENGMVNVKAPVTIDVAPGHCKTCSLTFSFMKEGNVRGTVYFRCKEREDITQGFDVAFKVLPKSISSVSELVAAVRTPAIHQMQITNPLSNSVTFSTRMENGNDTLFVDPSITVSGKSVGNLPIRFFPLLHKEYPVATVSATSAELGTTSCKLHLRSKPPKQEKVTQISCSLGQSLIFPLQFTCYSKANCDFTVRISGDPKTTAFSKLGNASNVKVQGTSRPEGQLVTVEMQYEPTILGEKKEFIEIISPVGGLYVFPILASCLPPKPQGPILVRLSQATLIPFKNVFNEPMTLSISTDSPNFVVSRTTENVQPKKLINITVVCKADETGNIAQTAKLIVSGVHQGETLHWVYYLKRESGDETTSSRSNLRRM